MSVLDVSGLGKAYCRYGSEFQRMASWFGLPAKLSEENWVLRNVSFSMSAGEAIGIVGQNGAGKSTLLKLITGTQRPSAGQVHVNGRISAILELGMGFNPEFTGRQNANHGLGLMGFSHDEIEEVMPELEAFAEIGDYFDQPVRTYSSGMQMRVAFAVVTAFRPEILIVDEALSVGDAAFQRKCFRRIEDFRSDGTTLLLVTHDIETVKRICDQAIWLCDGRLEMKGESKAVCECYEKHMFGFQSEPQLPAKKNKIGSIDNSLNASGIEVTYGGELAEITDFSIQNRLDQVVNVLPVQEAFSIKYKVLFRDNCDGVEFGMMVKTVEGVCVFAINSINRDSVKSFRSGDIAQVSFDLKNFLSPGTFYFNCGTTHLTDAGSEFLHRRLDVAILRVVANDNLFAGGIVDLQGRPSISFVENHEGSTQ